ncbi:glycosyltransferase family A protein [Salinicoccus roseus]|uniref:glycosyltransferase family A protein n=1 Tax=Salinicoccus roseus TaxID=45670 RepID=UPI0023010B35|nr:glycosyltransferase family A protein [Salinicoccus roseus]
MLSIYTPTYNRGDLLGRCYESLCNQDSKDFEWIIVDDGSTDDTYDIVQQWIEERKIRIRYHYKENGGVHTARNIGCELAKGELCVCIDSDDFLANGAVSSILNFWKKNKTKSVVGIVGLNALSNRKIVGTKLPVDIKSEKLYNLYRKLGVKGDKKLVYRTELIKNYKYPVFKGEKRVPPSYVYFKMDKEGDLLLMNEVLCIVEYQNDGISKNLSKDIKNSPNGMKLYYQFLMDIASSPKEKYKYASHYGALRMSAGLSFKEIYSESKAKFFTLLTLPTSIYLYIRNYK